MAIRDKIYWRRLFTEQQHWIADHGGDLIGYVLRYGSRHDPEHYGDGGEAIYAADRAELDDIASHLYR